MKSLLRTIKDLRRYPSAIAGLVIIFFLLVISIVAVVTIPYNRAIEMWRGSEDMWYRNPKNAPPEWTNLFRAQDLPVSFTLSTAEGTAEEIITENPDGSKKVLTDFTFDYNYADFPQEVALFIKSTYSKKSPFLVITWLTPDGREISVDKFSTGKTKTLRFSQESRLQRKFGGLSLQIGMFAQPDVTPQKVLPGTYTMRVEGSIFEPDSTVDIEFVLHGKVSGWAGTDYRRRDLGIALLWGTPIALSFGLLAALGTSITTMIIAAVGVWYSSWVDEIIQRITEVNLVLPFLPILIMISTFYSRSIWLILGATILLSIFGYGIKTYRAIFMQVRESPYVEAARAYGAKDWRIIILYLVPRIIPLLIPGLVTGIPAFVFLEASLAVLGLGDPILPTWGKVINDAQSNGALYQGFYYWVLEPAALLMLTGLAFAFLGFSLDRIFNPRLRGM